MIKESKYFIVKYNNIDYIDKLLNDIDNEAIRILEFFNIKGFNKKAELNIINTKKEFSKLIKELINLDDDEYGIGFVKDSIMYCLSFEDYKSTYYKDDTYEDFVKTIIHEFVHFCQTKKSIRCINEGLACYLSKQYENKDNIVFDCELDDLLNDKMVNYDNYYLIVKYIFDNYDKEYVDRIISDKEFARSEIEKIYYKCKEVKKL